MAGFDDFLGPEDGLVFDRIDIGRRSDERADRSDMHDAPHQLLLRGGIATSSISRSSFPRAGAALRVANRSFAERARGLATRSASLGTIGWPPSTEKVGAGGGFSPGRRRPAVSPRPERRAKNCLTTRSSSE